MVRPFVVLAHAALWAALLPAQGVVNPTLLQAPADAAEVLRPGSPAAVVAAVRTAVVHVAVEVKGDRGVYRIERASSGVLVDASGLVVTWAHLVAEASGASEKKIVVQLDDATNTELTATVVRIDAASGLALLRANAAKTELPAAQLGADRPAVGEPLVVLARPEGKDMLAFAGVASPALADVTLHGVPRAAADLFLCDARNDVRCDGAPMFGGDGRLLGLYASEHVLRDKSEPELADLKRPSFGACVPVATIRKAFAAEFAAAKNATLAKASAAGSPSWAAVAVQTAAPCVVSVWAGDGEWPALGGDDPGAVVRRNGLGSGVVLSAAGLVVCNAHGVAGGRARVRTSDGRTFAAKVQKRHAGTNLALLQLELPAGASLSPIVCAADEDVVLGERVLAIGNPLGSSPVVSAGVVSAKRDREGGRIQADPNLGNQNGGGAVVDAAGRLLGVVDAGAVDAIDVQYAMRGDRVSTETNLSTFVGVQRLRSVFAKELAAGAADSESIRQPAPATAAQTALRQSPLVAMVQKASGAMLNIELKRDVTKVDEDDPFASMAERKFVTMGFGSGVVIDRSGLAISNWHVVDEATNPDGSSRPDHAVYASVFGGKTYKVQVLSISREDDLSLLQLELAPGEEVHAVELGSSEQLRIGQEVAAIGNPHGKANSITFGVVSAKDQGINVRGRWAKLEHLIETDAAIKGGNSGGALLDMNGRLVGINSAGGGTFNNKGYAIAVDHVRQQILGLLLQAYKLRSPDLGMRVMDDAGAVVVLDVDPRGPAARAGVMAGDRIAELAGTPITWSPGFALTLLRQPANALLPLQLVRKGETKTVQATPLPAPVWAVVRQSGLMVRDLTYAEAAERVRAAAIGLHRATSGDRTGEPQQIPERMVVVDQVFAGEQPEGTDVQAGDLLLAAELRSAGDGAVLRRIADLVALRDLWNDRELGTYEGQKWKVWIARGSDVRAVELTAKRLFW
jgi:S1-C subfamily serine protease